MRTRRPRYHKAKLETETETETGVRFLRSTRYARPLKRLPSCPPALLPSWQFKTLSTIKRMLGHDTIDVLKMDIERSEFEVSYQRWYERWYSVALLSIELNRPTTNNHAIYAIHSHPPSASCPSFRVRS